MAPNGHAPPQGRLLDIPVLTDWRSTDSVGVLRSIMLEHERGMFFRSATLADEMLSDDRIAGVLSTRIGGLLCADLTFKPADDRRKSLKLARILGGSDEASDDGEWLRMLDFDTAFALLKWKILMGVAVAEIVWQTDADMWRPRLIPWHPRHLWWNWGQRVFQLVTSGPDPTAPYVVRGGSSWTIDLPRVDRDPGREGKWFVWGRPYSWMHGAIRALGMKFLDRTWNERDWSRYCEKHGMAIMEGKVPSGTDAGEKAQFLDDLRNVGNEPTIVTPQAPNGEPSYGIQMHEATSRTWETYKARKEALDTDIAVLLLGQNLTSEVSGGSFAAAQVHEGIRIDKKRQDAELFRQVRDQVLIPWTAYNFDSSRPEELAPYPEPQIEPAEDEESEANALKLLGDACQSLKLACPVVDVRAVLEAHGVPIDESLEAEAEAPTATPPAPPNPPPSPNGTGDGEAKPENETEPAERVATATALLSAAKVKIGKTAGRAALKRVAKYHDALVTRARKQAAKIMAPDLAAIRDDIDAATDYQDLRRRVVRRFRALKSPTELAGLIERLNLLGNVTARDDVLRGL